MFVVISPAIVFLWMLSLSLKFEIDSASYPPVFIPENFAPWKNYISTCSPPTGSTGLFRQQPGGDRQRDRACDADRRAAGYGIARMAARIGGGDPDRAYAWPVLSFRCSAVQWLGLLGTLVPQIIIHLVVTVPIVIWIMIGYFETTPLELEEAA